MMHMTFSINEAQMKRVFLWTLALIAVVLMLMFPEFAMAQDGGDGTSGYWGAGADNIKEQSDRSFRDWWEVGSTWMLWIGLGILIASVILLKGQGWWIALVVWALAAWGDAIVDWVGAL